MRVIVTCGPAWTPVDRMRRLTNASTGALGAALAGALHAAGHAVLLFRGETATAPPPPGVAVRPFGTNDDLAAQLRAVERPAELGAVLHAAALTDFEVARAADAAGHGLAAGKLPSGLGSLRLELRPAPKLLPRLRGWFPAARLAGWKYEVDGGPAAAHAAAERQLATGAVDVCVLNGPAHGPGFSVLAADGVRLRGADAGALAAWFVRWLAGT